MTGEFLFIHYGYDGDLRPSLTLHKDGSEKFSHLALGDNTATFMFARGQRYCAGWHDLATSQSFPCPDATALPAQFDHCRHCQNKTGFNPAFYHAASVSPQQQARNAQPHFLYLAHFAPGVVKVGISWAERGIRRVLDQGARSALIIKTYPSATIARQYEAKIAALPGIAETLQAKAKHKLLARPYDTTAAATELIAARERLRAECSISPDTHEPQHLDAYYLGDAQLNQPIMVQDGKISGRVIGMLGNTLLVEQGGEQYGLGLGDLTGYRLTISDSTEQNNHQPQQASLF
jgi:hypothetical protein